MFFFFTMAITLLTGCSSSFPDPVIAVVTPDRGWVGADEDIEIRGLNFYPRVSINASDGRDDVDDQFFVRLLGPIGSDEAAAHELPLPTIDLN